jgi:hypothetical protein
MNAGATNGKARAVFVLLLVAYALYAGAFIARTSFVEGGERVFTLFDDAMISMRYAKNLAAGHGLDWNPGEPPVEGYTNLLWVLGMAVPHLLGFPATKVSLAVQLAGAALVMATLFQLARAARLVTGRFDRVALAALLLTAFYLPLNNWALQGMEVGALAFTVTAALVCALGSLQTGQPSRALLAWLAATTLLRPDMFPLAFAMIGFIAVADRGQRRWMLTRGLGVVGLSLVAQTALRLAWFGDWLPNTYYLKVTGVPVGIRIGRGLLVYLDFVRRMPAPLFLIALCGVALRPTRSRLLLAGLFAVQSAYSIYVGGDAWEWWGGANRYLCVVMPAFFLLFAMGALDLLERLFALTSPRATGATHAAGAPDPLARHAGMRRAARAAFVLLVLVSLPLFNRLNAPSAIREWTLTERPLHAVDNQRMYRMARALERYAGPRASIAVVWAGTVPYFTGRPAVDMLGKNDRALAREPARVPPGGWHAREFIPGHTKWDYALSIGERRPDLISDFVGEPDEAAEYLRGAYTRVTAGEFAFYLRNDSEHLLRRGAGGDAP